MAAGKGKPAKEEVACRMPKETRWVHGNAIVAETLHPALEQVTSDSGTLLTYTDIVGLRQGRGVTYQGLNQRGNFNWFHAVIPTPTVVDGRPTRLERIFVLYDTPEPRSNPVSVREIHVWDGPDFIQAFDVKNGNAPHIGKPFVMGESQFEIDEARKREVSFGIGISIRVIFGEDPSQSGGLPTTVVFTGAGAEFSWLDPPVRRLWRGIFDRFFGG